MSNPAPNDTGKLQELIEKFGGWAAIALISVIGFMYQGDRANTQSSIAALEKNIADNRRAINRLQEGKVSREEFKTVQEQWIRETAGLRQDIRELTNALRVDINK
ncbi:MAG: hypothetical protein [Caudoviricetes sp.]|nr:MAG: hypothetical protein [Caudoviricetes sp.]